MSEPRRPDLPPSDRPDGGGAWAPSPWLLALAVGIVGAGLAAWWLSATSPPPPADDAAAAPASAAVGASRAPAAAPARVATAASAPASATPPPAAEAPRRIPRVRAPGDDQTPDITAYINDGETPTMAEVIDRLHQAGIHSGLGAFNPPGTRPLLVGLAVPEDFALPAGYVRHYQATDDGQRVEAILMFAPDFQLFDADHHPVPMPADRVVPPALAPPGLPIRRIAIPPPAAAPPGH